MVITIICYFFRFRVVARKRDFPKVGQLYKVYAIKKTLKHCEKPI